MKFLLALSVLASTSVFANDMDNAKWVKCYDTAQGSEMEVVYKLKKHDGYINLVYPESLQQRLVVDDGCLETYYSPALEQPGIRFCPTDGQHVNRLVPVDVTYGQEEETVYCEKGIVKWINWSDNTEM